MTFTTRPELRGTLGMVASTHWLASAVGMAALERGGNAFDAAVAAGLCLQVVEPHLNGPGGEVPILIHHAARGEVRVVCGQGVAPAAAMPESFSELGLSLVPGTGLLPACVPGAFDAWMLLLLEFGTQALGEVMGPAIGYAEHGCPVVAPITATIAGVAHLLQSEWPASAAVYLPRGAPPAPGTLLRNPALAAAYKRIVREAERASGDRDAQIEHARAAFYSGWVAEQIDSHAGGEAVMDSSGRRHRGLLTGSDLAGWHATLEPPVSLDYRGFTVHKTGPWGQGPVMLEQLALLDGLDLEGLGVGSAAYWHAVIEAGKLAFADREAWYGDPEGFDVPLEALLSPGYAAERRGLIGAAASADLRPGSPGGRAPRLPAHVRSPPEAPDGCEGVGEPTLGRVAERTGDTCHLDVADAHGNLVSATPSGGWLQSSPVIPGLGFPLGTRGQMFWLEQGLPASLAPRRRPRTTLTPTLVTRAGEPYLALGTPGGDQQDQWGLHFLLAHVHAGLDLQAAIDAPMVHSNHMPSSFYPRRARPLEVEVEERVGPAVVADLRARGHEVLVRDPWSLGRLSAAGPAPEGGLRAAANPRGMQGYAVGR